MEQPSDWKTLTRHPLSAEYVDIKGKPWELYIANLKAVGIPGNRQIVLHDGQVLDGWQLFRGCLELDMTPTFCAMPEGISPEDYVATVNDHRRHEPQKVVMRRLKERRERVIAGHLAGKSTRTLAEEEGVSHVTIHTDLKSGVNPLTPETGKDGEDREATATTAAEPTPATVKDKDGKTYPATKPILCDRCKRVGQVKDCNKCAELQAEAKKDTKVKPADDATQEVEKSMPAEPEKEREPGDDTQYEEEEKAREKAHKSGAVKFNLQAFESHIGHAYAELARLAHAKGEENARGQPAGKNFDRIRLLIGSVGKQVKAWYEEAKS